MYETGGGDSGEDDQDDSNNGEATGQNIPTIKKEFTPENDDPSVTPVFAKSCLRGSGCTDAGTESEPVDNFGEMSFYQAAAAAGTITHTGASESAGSTVLRLIGKAASRVLPGRLAVPNPVTVGVIGIFWSEGLNKGEEDYLNNIRLTQLATLQGTAPTRVRFQWVTNAITGKPEIRGYHTGSDGQISDQVPVRMLTPNVGHKDLYEFWESGAKGPSILWTPDNPGYAPPSDTGNDDVFVPPPSVLIYPLPTDTGSSTEILPMPEEKDFRDYILVHPTGDFDPIYVVLSSPHKYFTPPQTNPPLPAFPDAKKAPRKTVIQGGGGLRARWKDSKGKIYEWDSQHGTVEVYDKSGRRHLGEFDPATGKQTKPADPTRRVEK